jgi:GNAT superfamily N-acetyltransferase
MIIRPIRDDDTDALINMGARMHAEGAYAFLPYDRDKVRRFIGSFLQDTETRCGIVAEQDAHLVGMLAGYLNQYYFCDERVACDSVLFVEPNQRSGTAAVRLVRAFRAWAIERGAAELGLGISSNVHVERTGRLYERLGLTHVGGIYKQRLK